VANERPSSRQEGGYRLVWCLSQTSVALT